jgi:hypothetical protein
MHSLREDEMTTDTIQKIQACLTVRHNGGQKKIIDVEVLLKRHKAESVISLLKRLVGDIENGPKRDILGQVAEGKRTDYCLNFPERGAESRQVCDRR